MNEPADLTKRVKDFAINEVGFDWGLGRVSQRIGEKIKLSIGYGNIEK